MTDTYHHKNSFHNYIFQGSHWTIGNKKQACDCCHCFCKFLFLSDLLFHLLFCQCCSQFCHYLLRMMLQIRTEDHYQIAKRLKNSKTIKISNLRITFCKSKSSTQQAKAYRRGSLKLQFSICHLFEAFAEQS